MIETFAFNGAELRTLTRGGEPWFIAADVARVLGYAHTPSALRSHVDDEDRGTVSVQHSASETRATIINESGLYALIFGSKLPAARDFKRWVTGEVLPTIRRTGAYISADLSADQLLELALKVEAMQADADHTGFQDVNRGGVTLRALADEWGISYALAFDIAATFGDIKRDDDTRHYDVTLMGRQSGRVVPGDSMGRCPRITPKGREAYRKRLENWA